MTEHVSCYKCGSTAVRITEVSKSNIAHKGTHIKCANCNAERFYPTKE